MLKIRKQHLMIFWITCFIQIANFITSHQGSFLLYKMQPFSPWIKSFICSLNFPFWWIIFLAHGEIKNVRSWWGLVLVSVWAFMYEIFWGLFWYINAHVNYMGFYHAFLLTAFQACGWICHKIKVPLSISLHSAHEFDLTWLLQILKCHVN